ncbi:recombinase [Flavobacterium sp. U410]|jgi:site-specific recombinase
MKIFRRHTNDTFETLAKSYFNELHIWKDTENKVEILAGLIDTIRPRSTKDLKFFTIDPIIEFFKENEVERQNFIEFLSEILVHKRINTIFTDAGILQETDFFYEVKKRIFAKIIPYQAPKNTIEFVLNQVFYDASDSEWLEKIPMIQLMELFYLLDFTSVYEENKPGLFLSEVIQSMNLLLQRSSGKALETDVVQMVPEYKERQSPFSGFEKELYLLEDILLDKSTPCFVGSQDIIFKQLNMMFKQCNEFVDKAFHNASKYGISLRVNQNLLRIRQQLKRLGELLPFLVIDKEEEKTPKTIQLILLLIKHNSQKNNIQTLVSDSVQVLSYEITQHTAKTGEKYITETRKDYFKMFYAALGGGFIVGILCIFKVLLSKIPASDFGHAFLYSMNYAFGFIAIYLTGFTLATKQPAMTASALIKAIQEGMKKKTKGLSEEKHHEFAILFSHIFRTQFIAFAGNVIMAFPVALLGIWLIDLVLNYNITETKWLYMINQISPVKSPAVFHAAIAGFFLFLSGIISGSISNRDKHFQVYYRIQEHPWLKRTFSKETAKRVSEWYEKKWAGIMSNFWFGIFMGTTASVGAFLGLNLDIRHITFSVGNFALSLYGSNYHLSQEQVIWAVIGIILIGFVNFIVSFSFSLALAFKSRNIPVQELKLISRAVWHYFRKKPMRFFFPAKAQETA